MNAGRRSGTGCLRAGGATPPANAAMAPAASAGTRMVRTTMLQCSSKTLPIPVSTVAPGSSPAAWSLVGNPHGALLFGIGGALRRRSPAASTLHARCAGRIASGTTIRRSAGPVKGVSRQCVRCSPTLRVYMANFPEPSPFFGRTCIVWAINAPDTRLAAQRHLQSRR